MSSPQAVTGASKRQSLRSGLRWPLHESAAAPLENPRWIQSVHNERTPPCRRPPTVDSKSWHWARIRSAAEEAPIGSRDANSSRGLRSNRALFAPRGHLLVTPLLRRARASGRFSSAAGVSALAATMSTIAMKMGIGGYASPRHQVFTSLDELPRKAAKPSGLPAISIARTIARV